MGASYGEWQPWKLRMVSGMSCGSGGWYGSHGRQPWKLRTVSGSHGRQPWEVNESTNVTCSGLVTDFEGQLLQNNKEEKEDKLASRRQNLQRKKKRKEALLFHSFISPASAITQIYIAMKGTRARQALIEKIK